jgi:hypothetical protein
VLLLAQPTSGISRLLRCCGLTQHYLQQLGELDLLLTAQRLHEHFQCPAPSAQYLL